MRKPLGTAAAILLAAAGMLPATAVAGPSVVSKPNATSAGGCGISVGSVTAGGDHGYKSVVAATPPTATAAGILGRAVYPDGAVRISSSMSWGDDGVSIAFVGGYSVLGGAVLHAILDR
jgi:hypothetical protein